MATPLVSVIIPAYNQAEFLAETIQSVLNQTYQNFEIIVVNDASPDNTDEVMMRFIDSRIHYIVHEKNLRLPAARNTGMQAAKGEIFALLDADDLFHPEKLAAHVQFLTAHPEVGVSYNARYDLNHSASTIRELWRPPLKVGLIDLMQGFPFSPSDTVLRRDWAFKAGLFNPEMGSAEDTDFPCRLALAGCQFAGIDRALNYRRYHSGRGRKNLEGRLHDVERALAGVLNDPRCPAEARELGYKAIKHHMMVIISLALMQRENEVAQKYLRRLVGLTPAVIHDNPSELVEFLLSELIIDDNLDHENILKDMFAVLNADLPQLAGQYQWAVQRGYMWRAIRAVIWDRIADGRHYFRQAVRAGAQIDEPLMQWTTYHLLGFEHERGYVEVFKVLTSLRPLLNQVAGGAGNRLEASYLVNRAFEDFHAGNYRQVPGKVVRAWRRDLSYLFNRGVLSVFIRSLWKRLG